MSDQITKPDPRRYEERGGWSPRVSGPKNPPQGPSAIPVKPAVQSSQPKLRSKHPSA